MISKNYFQLQMTVIQPPLTDVLKSEVNINLSIVSLNKQIIYVILIAMPKEHFVSLG